MNCYRCNSTEQLSIKYRTKYTKIPKYLCLPCRRTQRASSIPTDRIKMPKSFDMEEWERLAQESMKRINERYKVTHG